MAASGIFRETERGNLPGVKRCIQLFPGSLTSKNEAQLTALHIAAEKGQAAIVRELLVHGASHETADPQGNIPLHLAAEQGSVETVAELLAGRKASVKTKNKNGQTPLHIAVLAGHKEVVAKLLETGIQVDGLKDKAGNTPLSLVDPDDMEMQQIFANSKSGGGASPGAGAVMGGGRGGDTARGGHRSSFGGAAGTASPGASTNVRNGTSPAVTLAAGMGVGPPAGTPTTPPPARGVAAVGGRALAAAGVGSPGIPGVTRAPAPLPASGVAGALTSRLPRNSGIGNASPGHSGGGALSEQLARHDTAIQSLQDAIRAATDRLGAVDAMGVAQLETVVQVEKALGTCSSHGRALLDLETRVAFQEERGRDSRARIERLEEGERNRQDTVKRLSDEHRSLTSQLQKLAEQVSTNANSLSQRLAPAGDPAGSLSQLQAELSVLRAQLDQLSPALSLATAASAEARTLAARLDVVQQQVQQQQCPPSPAHQHLGGSVVMEQQVLQLQAQVQLLQLPVASLTQQVAELSNRMGGLTEWQQQARADLARLAEAAAAHAQQGNGSRAGVELSDAVMRVLDTTARTMAELRQQQDETAKQLTLLMQQQQQQAAVLASSPPPAGPPPPAVPGTPQSASRRMSGAGDPAMGPLGGPPSRSLHGPGSATRDAAAHAEVRAELESLKAVITDIRKEVATEGGSLRREWQRAFSDMQSRYGEQANELRAREANIAKLREAALVEEAERRAASGFEDKFSARLGKLETNVEYLTHRLEVLEEQVSGVATTLAGATSPVGPVSPSRMAAALAAMRGQAGPPRGGPGPVSENRSGFVSFALDLAVATAAAGAPPSARVATSPKQARYRSAGGREAVTASGAAAVQSDGGCLLRRLPLFGSDAAKDAGSFCVAGGGGEGHTASVSVNAPEPSSARDRSKHGLGPEKWWRAAHADPPELQGRASSAGAPEAAEAGRLRASQHSGGGAPLPGPGKPAASDELGGLAPRQLSACAPWAPQRLSDEATATATMKPGCMATVQPAQRQLNPVVLGQAALECAGLAAQSATPGPPQLGPPSVVEHVSASGAHILQGPYAALQGIGGGGPLDPAHVALGPQLLTPMAHALLTPSVDIQRLAAAAAAQQQQQELSSHQQNPQPMLAQPQAQVAQPWVSQQPQLWLPGSPALGVAGRQAEAAGQTLEPGGEAAPTADARVGRQNSTSTGKAGSGRKEPPLCFFCPMQ